VRTMDIHRLGPTARRPTRPLWLGAPPASTRYDCGYHDRVFLKSVQFNHLRLLEESCARPPCGQIHFIDHMHPTTPSTTSAASSVMRLTRSAEHAGGIRPIDVRRTAKPGGPGIDHGTKTNDPRAMDKVAGPLSAPRPSP